MAPTSSSTPTHPKAHKPPMATQSASVYRRIATMFFALTAGVLVLAAYIVFARAEVVVLSEPQDVKGDFIIDISRQPSGTEVKGDVVEMSETLTETFPSSSVVGVSEPAWGKVKIMSTLARPQKLIATTRLITADNKLYRIRSEVTVPAGGSVTTDAYATEVGEKYEVPKDTTFTIPGLSDDLRPKFTTTAEVAFESGLKELRSISQSDIDKATEALREKALGLVAEKLRTKARETQAPTTGELVAASDVSRISDAKVGSDAASFSMTVTVKAVGVFYDADAFAAEVKRRLSERLYDGRVIQQVDGATLERELEKRDLIAGRANIGVKVRGSSILSPSSPALASDKLTGISDSAAKQYLESVEGVASASVKAVPFWMHRMPNVADHIKVEVR